jgi:hypothetical protein
VAQHLGPVTFLPQPRHAAGTVTTMPTTTLTAVPRPETAAGGSSSSQDSVYLPAEKSAGHGRFRRFLASCVAVAGRSMSLVVRYKVELVPVFTVSSLTGLGWAQSLAGAGTMAAVAYSALAVASAGVAVYGLERKHHQNLVNGGAGVAIALADVAAGVGAGPGAVSLTAAGISTGLAYAVYVPWLLKHRKDQKELQEKQQEKQQKTPSGMVNGASAVPAVITAGTPIGLGTADEPNALPAVPQRSPFHDEVIPYSGAGESDNIADPIRLGWDEHGQPVHLTVLYRHTLVAGTTDFGKSGLINLIIMKLLRKKHVDLYGIDLKPGAPELGPWAPLFKRIARTPEEARDLLDFQDAEGKRRGAYLERLSRESLAAGGGPVKKWIPGDPSAPKDSPEWGHGPAVVTITDELGELIRQDDELRKQEAEMRRLDPESYPVEQEIATRYESGLAVLRFVAMMFVSATQQPSNRIFGGNTDARGNYNNRISTRTGEAGHARLVFGEGCKAKGFVPEKLTRPGEFFIAAPEFPQESPARCRAEFVDDLDIAAAVGHLHQAGVAEPNQDTADRPKMRLVKTPPLSYPDGTSVGADGQPALYRLFLRLCEENGAATKQDLTEHGPFDSRDTVRRAVDVWLQHGVHADKAGRAEQFSIPTTDDTD